MSRPVVPRRWPAAATVALAIAAALTGVTGVAHAGPDDDTDDAADADAGSSATDDTAAKGPAALRLSLADALALAARRAPAIQRAALDAVIADGDASAADDRPWTLTARGRTQRRQLGLTTAPAVSVDSTVAEASLDHRFVTGTTVSATGTTTVTGAPASSLSLALSQPLLRGARPAIVDAPRAAAEQLAAAAEASERAITTDSLAAVATAYWELVFAHADLEIRTASLASASEQTRLTRSLQRGGQVPRAAVLAVEQAAAIRAEAVVLAEQAIAERSLLLRDLVGLPVGPDDVLVDPADRPPAADVAPVDVAAVLAAAERGNPTLAVAEHGARAADLIHRAADDATLPGLDLGVSATAVDAGAEAAPPAAPAASAGGEPEVTMLATLTLSYDLGGPRHGLRDRARAAARRARFDRDETRRQLRLAVSAAAVRVDSAGRRVGLMADVERRAADIARAEVARFTAGQATVFDVLARQDELEDARRRGLRAAIDLAQARLELGRVVGEQGR